MAKPIKETPVLYDEDAYRFEMSIKDVKPLSESSKVEMRQAYEELKKVAQFAV